ncbi:MAG: glucose 1-dehydrogenase [Hyphomicrobiales bacterium]|nr:glucose 1-dehydrogenase [Hyphomicrobiales bacterium]
MGRVDGKAALVTGAASGLGAASARLLAAEGARVLLTDLDGDGAARVAADMGGAAIAAAHDVTNEDDWKRVVAQAVAAFGGLHILVNSAGVAYSADVENTTFEQWRWILGVNLDGTFLGCKHGLGAIRATGQGGSIINLSSVSGLVGGHNLAAYNASKGGVRLLTKSVALHAARTGSGIRCNSVHPSFAETPMIDALLSHSPDPARTRGKLERQIPLGRLGQAEEVAAMVLYLASDESAFVTGAEMVIDGGLTA